jgi:GNAT superfamily N-acetyltransferase
MRSTLMHQIVEGEDSASVVEDLESRLKSFNEHHAGPADTQPLVLSVRDNDGNLIAGLTGEFFWNALYVAVVWVDEPHRGLGYGASLLKRAERVARERACEVVYLSTFGFQAPGFYLKQGYKVIGELHGVPHGSTRQWFCKLLSEDAV